ncbi:hypothetical protein D3C87_376110 [compost metagenome]
MVNLQSATTIQNFISNLFLTPYFILLNFKIRHKNLQSDLRKNEHKNNQTSIKQIVTNTKSEQRPLAVFVYFSLNYRERSRDRSRTYQHFFIAPKEKWRRILRKIAKPSDFFFKNRLFLRPQKALFFDSKF